MSWIRVRPAMGWQLVPVTALLVYTLSVTLSSSLNRSGADIIASFQDEPFLELKTSAFSLPGVGFFNQSNIIKQPYGEVMVWQESGRLTIEWPVIANVEKYNFRLWKTANKDMLVNKHDLTVNSITVDSSLLTKGLSYNWKITADTTDGYSVTTAGGIVKN